MSTKNIPEHLSPESREWFAAVVRDYNLEPHHLKLLQAAAECWDRATQARVAIGKDGITYIDRHKNIRPHPGCQIERDNKTLFSRLLRELALDVEEPSENRPPIIRGNSTLKVS